jgi:hypothetical protein
MKAERAAGMAWAGLIASVAAYDYLAPEGQTLSEGVDRALEKRPLLTAAAIGMTAMHLLNIYEHLHIEHLDPIHQLANLARRKTGE